MIYDPRDPATIQDPLPALLWLQEHDPVHWSPALKGWVFTRYDDVRTVQLGRGMSADRLTPFYASLGPSEQAQLFDVIRYLNTWVAFKDPPDHTRLRQLMNQAFTPSVIRKLEAGVIEIVDELLLGLRGRETFDFIADFANPLPATVIMDLLGVPRHHMEALREWSAWIQPFLGNATVSDNKYGLAREGIRHMADFFREVIATRDPGLETDLVAGLVRAWRAGDLGEDEIVGMCILLLFAGHETTTNLIGNALRALLAHPETLAELRADPTLIEGAIEEVLRWDGPTGALVRVVAADHEREGRTLRQGERVFIMVNAANRDPRKFSDPGRFDIRRSPNPHLSFNTGPHFCLGAPLARMEARIAINRFLAAFATIELVGGPPEYMDTLVMRGVREMPVRVRRQAAAA